MATQMDMARAGRVSPEVEAVARDEGRDPEALIGDIAAGRVAIPANLRRGRETGLSRGIGRGLRTKTNANIGTSRDSCDLATERAKLHAAEAGGADSVMDLSTAGDLRATRRALLADTNLLFGTVPIYEAAVEVAERGGSILDMTPDSMFAAVRRHAEDGVDFVTVHAGVTRRVIAPLGDLDTPPDASAPDDGPAQGGGGRRLCSIVSRGGAFMARWMLKHDAENPFNERFDEMLGLAREFDLTLSIGDGLRPGALADAGDEAQMAELVEIAALVRRAREAGVQTIVEGPGHVPLHEVRAQMETAKRLTGDAPLYVLGPIVTDVAAGRDHIAAAIGGALAGWAGADFLCVVTPAEHLALPDPEDVREGVIAARIAAHAADLALGLPGAREWDDRVSRLRRAQDWDAMTPALMDPARAKRVRGSAPPAAPGTCSMCGPYCVFRPPVS